jgi:hypothetical protein
LMADILEEGIDIANDHPLVHITWRNG